MTEEEGPKYKDGDIVWVKLGPCWWPGEVTEDGPEDFTSKKPPLVIVKFFNESTYEFVKSYNNVYAYNCDRKNEFIKKGMDSFRANNSHMEKFPGDVSLAELRTDGNPNILSEPMFAPQKKSNVIAEVFGSPSPRKANKDGGKHKGRTSSSKHSPKKPKINITHRRFLGCDDYEAHIRLQYPGKDTEHVSSDDEEIVRLNAEPTKILNCSQCPFNTNRLEVMLFHVQCHIKGIASHVQVKKKAQKKKKPRVVPKPSTSDDDRTNSSAGFLDTDSEEEIPKPKPKRKRRAPASPKKTKPKKEEEGGGGGEDGEEKSAPVSDIRTHLLAEWSDSEESETKLGSDGEAKTRTEEKEPEKEAEKAEKEEQTSKDLKSCFDFDEEEEEDDIVHTAAAGRKIPRVIPPPSDKRKSTEEEPSKDDEPAEPETSAKEVVEEEVFKDLMESTAVPDLPEVPDTLKPSQNFSDGKTVKIPDKEVATKLTNPKKRFVKSFEDFELLQNEKRAQEEREKAVVVEPVEQVVEEPDPPVEVASETPTPEEDAAATPEEKERTPPPEPVDPPKVDEANDILKKLDANLQISKLKCQIMSKLSDEEPEPPKIAKPTKTTSHRTPRSKILESYRNDKYKEEKLLKEKPAEETEEEEEEEAKEEPTPAEPEPVEEEEEEDEPSKSDVMKEIEAIPEKNPDEEIGKINQIDDYLNDFLFNIPPKKAESPKPVPEEPRPRPEPEPESKGEDGAEAAKPPHEVQIKCASSDENESDSAISIKTNLTNFNRNEEEMSALSTLAMVSQLDEPLKQPQPELVPIDGNLTVVSEKDLADAQVEITADSSPTCKKPPVTLTNFSMDFSECNSNSTNDSLTSESSENKPKEEEVKKAVQPPPPPPPGPEDMFDIEEHIPSQIVGKLMPVVKEPSPPPPPPPPSSKLLERLTEPKPKDNSTPKLAKVPMTKDSTKIAKTKFVVKQAPPANKLIKTTPQQQSNKPIILSEKIIKPIKAADPTGSVSVQKITSKRNLQDPDEIDTFIIQKGTKSVEEDDQVEANVNEDEIPAKKVKKGTTTGMDAKKLQVSSNATAVKKRGKAKILQQTIITPAGEIIQPAGAAAAAAHADDNVFDINSMPIVLSDQILTPESIENMPIYLSDAPEPPAAAAAKVQTATIVKKTTPVTVQNQPMRVLNKSISSPAAKLVKTPKILGSSVGSKLIKNSFASGSSKHGKYVIVTQPTTPTSASKYTVGKKPIVRRVGGDVAALTTAAGTLTKMQGVGAEPTGNKIMILTDQQGQQQRVLLTPAQQKMMGYQTAGTKVTKTVVKGSIIQKPKDAIAGSSGLLSKTISSPRLNSTQTLISSSGHVLTPIHPHQAKSMRLEKPPLSGVGRKIQMQSQKVPIKPPPQKTILIKNQHGQTVRKIQGTDDALLDRQVAEQIEAIKASGVLQQKHEVLNYKSSSSSSSAAVKAVRRSYAKKIESPKSPAVVVQQKPPPPPPKAEAVVPPLAPISPKKPEPEPKERALHQLVIQDAMGNQTTITEGQILALPSETIDGQPQSYMLVTLDESGNLTPLNNEALLSLDPNLGLGGDLGNTVLQIDQSALKEEEAAAAATAQVEAAKPEPEKVERPKPAEPAPEAVEEEQIVDSSSPSVMQTMGDSGQQLIVTGDPIAAQKFLESLTEGNTDLANILANAEGSSILIHADGQQILINTDSDNQMLLSVNTDNLNMTESTEGGGNPIFATQPAKNQDILAAALADTDVFQQEQNGSQGKVSQLSPNSTLYPMNVGNVLETSLTLNSPIMTPLEVPSTNSKKISDENDILGQVPKNVDLPITITDPNISQTVAQQQIVNELQSNLELSISDSVTSAAASSPSFVYSLPNLEKPFNSSMPLLTEDSDESKLEEKAPKEKEGGSFLDESEGLCTLGGEMCSSLSEPPPDMFDLSAVLSSHQIKTTADSPKEEAKVGGGGGELVIMEENESASSESGNPETASVTETSSPNTTNEDSCEIPVQPNIVTTLKEVTTGCKRGSGDEMENDSKKCKFD